MWSVASRTNVGSHYVVDIENGRCECLVGIDGSPYWHQFILWCRGFSCYPNFLPLFDNSRKKRFAEIAIGSSLESSFYHATHPCSEPEPSQIAEPSINQNSSVDQVDVSLSSGKVTHNQTLEIKTSESNAEEFEKFTEAAKEKVSSGTSTQFNKALQKFRKRYEIFTENQKNYSISKLWFNICWKIKK